MATDAGGGVAGFYADLSLDHDVPIPLYYQLQEELRRKIEQGQLVVGARLPPERMIAEELGVSRTTVRQAMDRLCDDGILIRRRGAGTFVAPVKLVSNLTLPRSLSAEADAQGRRTQMRVLEMCPVRPDEALRALLAAADEPHSVLRLRRLRLIEGEVISLETSWLPRLLCAPLLDVDLSGSLSRALSELCGLTVVRNRSQLTATLLDSYEAQLLETAPRSAAFRFEGVSWDDADRPVEVVETLLRGDRFRFEGQGSLGAEMRAYALSAEPVPTSTSGLR